MLHTGAMHSSTNLFSTFLYIKYCFSIFQYSQVVKETDSYSRLQKQQYLADINFKYIFEEIFEIPTHKYQKHNSIGRKMPCSLRTMVL